MEHLYKYVPTVEGKLVQILCSGDGQTVERMVHAHLGANGWSAHQWQDAFLQLWQKPAN